MSKRWSLTQIHVPNYNTTRMPTRERLDEPRASSEHCRWHRPVSGPRRLTMTELDSTSEHTRIGLDLILDLTKTKAKTMEPMWFSKESRRYGGPLLMPSGRLAKTSQDMARMSSLFL